MDEKGVEAAAIALAEYCTKLWLGGNHAPAWREVHEDVREEYRKVVRLILNAYEPGTAELKEVF